MAAAPAVGQLVGRYRLLREVGAGGMGTVYEAVHEEIGHRAAIKILRAALADEPQLVQRFLNEARAANRIQHPGFVEVYELGRLADGIPYMVMEFLDGELLAQRFKRFPEGAPIEWTLDLARQTAAALAAAHACGVVHRDLKPANIMLVPHSAGPAWERVKILDLGIAKLDEQALGYGAASRLRTATGLAMGTPHYMAPEQCGGAGDVDGQADVYSLGVILYEGLAGHRPFTGQSALQIMNQQVFATPVPLWVVRPDLPNRLATLVEQLLAKQAGERPTMRQLEEAARQLGGAAPLPPMASAPISRLPSPVDPIDCTTPRFLPAQAIAPIPPWVPFIAGPPIAEPRHFVGRLRELRHLCDLWRLAPLHNANLNANLIGPKRAGKTSLLLTLKNAVAGRRQRVGQELAFLPPRGTCQFIYVDFQDPRLGTIDGLLRHLLTGLRLAVPTRCDLEYFFQSVAGRLPTPTVILLDEIEVAVERYQALDATFWDGLHTLATSHTEGQLGFVLCSQQPAHELARVGGLPFFNVFGYCATLGPWSEDEARSLAALSPVPIGEDDLLWIMEQSQRWPILMQILCRERLLAFQEGDDLWRDEALRQLAPFSYLLKGSPSGTPT